MIGILKAGQKGTPVLQLNVDEDKVPFIYMAKCRMADAYLVYRTNISGNMVLTNLLRAVFRLHGRASSVGQLLPHFLLHVNAALDNQVNKPYSICRTEACQTRNLSSRSSRNVGLLILLGAVGVANATPPLKGGVPCG